MLLHCSLNSCFYTTHTQKPKCAIDNCLPNVFGYNRHRWIKYLIWQIIGKSSLSNVVSRYDQRLQRAMSQTRPKRHPLVLIASCCWLESTHHFNRFGGCAPHTHMSFMTTKVHMLNILPESRHSWNRTITMIERLWSWWHSSTHHFVQSNSHALNNTSRMAICMLKGIGIHLASH